MNPVSRKATRHPISGRGKGLHAVAVAVVRRTLQLVPGIPVGSKEAADAGGLSGKQAGSYPATTPGWQGLSEGRRRV